MQHLTKIADLTRTEVVRIVEKALVFHEQHNAGCRREDVLAGRVIALVFEKPSLRTKIAFEVAAQYLGGTAVFLSSSQILASGNNQHGRESIPDIGRNLERFADLIAARVYRHETILELAASVRVPVVNALCDRHHPTQALADLTAMIACKGQEARLKVAYVGDGNNVATSLVQLCTLWGFDVAVATPTGFELPPTEVSVAQAFAVDSGSAVEFTADPVMAVVGADVVYTDTFVSMGQEAEKALREKAFTGYQVTTQLMAKAKPDAVFMHCLPAHRGEEVTNEVMDGRASIVFDQAEFRLHVIKALLSELLLP